MESYIEDNSVQNMLDVSVQMRCKKSFKLMKECVGDMWSIKPSSSRQYE
uniref:Uncharacterized protein n=1 Tax=Nymphaea colorata TaxID=210225 RepID=A0A5K0YAR4_9MAGN|nr:unnamed protein product [Nymphaea colorata]